MKVIQARPKIVRKQEKHYGARALLYLTPICCISVVMRVALSMRFVCKQTADYKCKQYGCYCWRRKRISFVKKGAIWQRRLLFVAFSKYSCSKHLYLNYYPQCKRTDCKQTADYVNRWALQLLALISTFAYQ